MGALDWTVGSESEHVCENPGCACFETSLRQLMQGAWWLDQKLTLRKWVQRWNVDRRDSVACPNRIHESRHRGDQMEEDQMRCIFLKPVYKNSYIKLQRQE